MSTHVESAVAPAAHARVALWEDFVDIFYAPSHVFARREHGSFWVPLFVVAMLMGALFFLNSGAMQPVLDAEYNRGVAVAMRRNPPMNAEAMERFRVVATRLGQVFAFVIPVAFITA